MTRLDLLAFGAHPDDIELAVGGTLTLMKSKGYAVGAVDATRGELGTRGTPEIRARECADASRLLGLDVRVNLGLPDGSVFDDVAARAAVISRPSDLSPDHRDRAAPGRSSSRPRAVGDASRGGVLPVRGCQAYARIARPPSARVVAVRLAYDVRPLVRRRHHVRLRDEARGRPGISKPVPRPRVDRTCDLHFASRVLGWWEGRARHYGNMIGVEYGEAFFVKSPLRLDDPISVFKDFGYYPK
jgi:hypothetical protein